MKLFISSDMEGTCGITFWDEADHEKGGRFFDYFRAQMTREVSAACAGALEAGAAEVRVKDAHGGGRTIIPTELPMGVSITRGFGGGPFSMVLGLDQGFDALAFTGYHSAAHGNGNPLAHTMNSTIDEMIINGKRASEFAMWVYTAAMLHIPVIFLSGDEALCNEAKEWIPGITTAALNRGRGASVTSIHPKEAETLIKEGMKQAVKSFLETGGKQCLISLPQSFDVTIKYKEHAKALYNSYYPGAKQINEKTIGFTAANYSDVMRFFHFVL